MKLAIDVQYLSDEAVVAGVLFHDWQSEEAAKTLTKTVRNIAPYEPGSFYKRELPCIKALLDQVNDPLDYIVIDGFVTLGSDERDGLGMHLYRAINNEIPIVGVAKKAFLDTPASCEIYRGDSKKPLFVTSVGIDLQKAKELILSMAGRHRIPALLKRADQLCRGITG